MKYLSITYLNAYSDGDYLLSPIRETELSLTNIQIDSLKSEVAEYDVDGIIFLYELALDAYKKGSTMYNFTSAKIQFLKTLKLKDLLS